MKAIIPTAALAVLVAACGGATETPTEAAPAPAIGTGSAPSLPPAAAAAAQSGAPAAVVAGDFADRTIELTNPDNPTMIYLYYDLAGLPIPLDAWVEHDSRVQYKTGVEKQTNRDIVRNEITAGIAAVKGVGLIRLTTNAGLSEYDPTYGEFTVQSLAPSSTFTFMAHDTNVSVKFANGQAAQTWKVPAAEAQGIRDKVQYLQSVNLDVLLKILRVQPAAKGGAIITQVMSYELRDGQSAAVLGRVTVPN